MKDSNNISIDARYRTMLILWVGQMMSVIMFFVVTQFANSSAEPDPSTSSSLSWVFLGLGALSAIISFLVRSKILQRSVEKQDPALVQTGVTVGLALCEVPALLGVVTFCFSRQQLLPAVCDRCRRNGASFSSPRFLARRVL